MLKDLLVLITFLQPIILFGGNKTLTYTEAIDSYKRLDSIYQEAKLFTYGKTDCGEPLHLFVISLSGKFEPASLHEANKCIVMINNGIHPGEPDGIDASVRLAGELLSKPLYRRTLENVVVCIIPVFNIDGALRRGCCTRANQNGPEEYGFRANAKNLDLNRDFIKADTRNTRSLISILRKWNPDVFIDTHVSDGADYQYTMTLISTQEDKMSPPAAEFMEKEFLPALYSTMKEKNDEMIPYVNVKDENSIPDSGIVAFMESPRFLGGYQSLFDCFNFTVETHMFKPFDQRVNSTFNLLTTFIEVADEKADAIRNARNKCAAQNIETFRYNWKPDFSKAEQLSFKGYQAETTDSRITGKKRLRYNRSKPFEKYIPYYKSYIPTDSIRIPQTIVIPQAWEEFVNRLEQNGIVSTRAVENSKTNATVFYIENYQTVKTPYEGHYLHYDVKTRKEKETIEIRKGDYLIQLPQRNIKYVMETLVPDAVDSYFCWGFFDSILQQKEWFSDYIFEDTADSLLTHDPKLKKEFTEWKSKNPSASSFEQLDYIYKRSEYFEKTFMKYPVSFVY